MMGQMIQMLALVGQFMVAMLNLGQHVVEVFDQNTHFIDSVIGYSPRIVFILGNGIHGCGQLFDRF